MAAARRGRSRPSPARRSRQRTKALSAGPTASPRGSRLSELPTRMRSQLRSRALQAGPLLLTAAGPSLFCMHCDKCPGMGIYGVPLLKVLNGRDELRPGLLPCSRGQDGSEVSMLTGSTIVGIRQHDSKKQQGGSSGPSRTCVKQSLMKSVGGEAPNTVPYPLKDPCRHAWLGSASASSVYDKSSCCDRRR